MAQLTTTRFVDELINEIRILKDKRNAIILAHNIKIQRIKTLLITWATLLACPRKLPKLMQM